MDGMGLAMMGVWAARREAESSRPWAPVIDDGWEYRAPGGEGQRGLAPGRSRRRRRPALRAARPRSALARGLHHVADVLDPAPGRSGHPAR